MSARNVSAAGGAFLALVFATACSSKPAQPAVSPPAEARRCTQFDGSKPSGADSRWDVAAALVKREAEWRTRAREVSARAGTTLGVSTDEPGVVLGVVKRRVAALVEKGCTIELEADDLAKYSLACEGAAADVDRDRKVVEDVVRVRFPELAAIGRESLNVGSAPESVNYAVEDAQLLTDPRSMVDKDTSKSVDRLKAHSRRLENMCNMELLRLGALQHLPESTVEAATGGTRKQKEDDDPRLFCKRHAEECMLGCASASADACYSLFVMFDALREKETGAGREMMSKQRSSYRRQAIELYATDCDKDGESSVACKKKASLEAAPD